MSLWNAVCSVLLCSLWEKEHWRIVVGSSFSHKGHFFLSQSPQSSRSFLAHISSPQNASGIQSSQSVIANEDTIRRQKAAYILPIGVSRWSLPFPSGEGSGEGPLSFCPLCVLFFCVLCEKKYVILFLSLCHYVLKNNPFCYSCLTLLPCLPYPVSPHAVCSPV